MKHDSNPAFDDWKRRAGEADILAVATQLGFTLKRAGAAELVGPCPACGGTDRFSINTKKRVFNCRGGEGGGVVAMAMHAQGVPFVAACEAILNEPPPARASQYRAPDPAVARERREEAREDQSARARAEAAALVNKAESAADLFARARPIEGTLAQDYLEARGLHPKPSQLADIRFIPKLPYFGYEDAESSDVVELARYHCMVSAIRDVAGAVIGVHRTYLDTINGVASKARPPGAKARNGAKKAFGRTSGGLIRLGPIGSTLAVGEGIETTLSWYELGLGPDDVTIACAAALGNLCGGSLTTVPHPKIKGRHIMDGRPDPQKPGMVLPPEVRTLILIGDGDSDPFETRQKLLTGARRYRDQGIEVLISMAPDKQDFNDVLASRGRMAA